MKELWATEVRYLRKVEGVMRMDILRSDGIRERLHEAGICSRNCTKKKEAMEEED